MQEIPFSEVWITIIARPVSYHREGEFLHFFCFVVLEVLLEHTISVPDQQEPNLQYEDDTVCSRRTIQLCVAMPNTQTFDVATVTCRLSQERQALEGQIERIVWSATYSYLFELARFHQFIDEENVYEFAPV